MNALFNGNFLREDIKEYIKEFLEHNGNESATYLYLWDTVNALLRG